MFQSNNEDLKIILHPYVFALKEGKKINDDYLDFSLQMLQVSCPEKIKSPKKVKIKLPFSKFDLLSLPKSEQPSHRP